MEVTKAVKVALNALVDIASHSTGGQLVPAPQIAQRLHMSISRIELLLRPLRESGLVIAAKGRTGGYQLLQDPCMITIKDIVLAMNRIKKRKVEVSDMAKDLYQSLESYMKNYISGVTLTSTIKDNIPRFSEVKSAPERKSFVAQEQDRDNLDHVKPKAKIPNAAHTSFKKVEEITKEITLGPNSIFSFADYLNKNSPAN